MELKTGKLYPYRRHLSTYYITTGLMVVLLGVNFFFWQYTKAQIYRISHASYSERITRLTNEAQDQVDEYLQIADEGKTLFLVNPSLDRKQFTTYFQNTLELRDHRYKAISTILFADYVTKPADYAAKIRGDRTTSPVGYPYFSISPTVTTPATVVNYIVPYENHSDLFGYNIMTDVNQQEYLANAHISRKAVATEKQLFLNAQRIAIYQPIFQVEGTHDLIGYLTILVDPDVLFQAIANVSDTGISLQVYKGNLERIDGASAANLYFGDKTTAYLADTQLSGDYQAIRHINMAGQQLTLVFTEPESAQITWFQRALLNGILYGGTVTIMLIFMALNYLIFWNNEARTETA